MSASTTTTAVNGSQLLEACNFDRIICASIISTRDDWQELLDSITSPGLRKNVAAAVYAIRQALGLEAGYALNICQGRE
jgi:hypothetical protein